MNFWNTARIVGTAQIALSIIYVIGYFWLLMKFVDGEIKTPESWKDQVGILMGVLTTGVTMILGFWFSRARPEGKPGDPQ